MLEQKIRLVSEGLARGMGRRNFLKQAGTTIFGGMAALAAGQALSGTASATREGPQPKIPTIQCAPPGPYCNTGGGDLSGCHGSSCFQHGTTNPPAQCQVYYQYYQAGCWTTASNGGYWTCCDCRCTSGATCGCAQFSTGPVPRPDAPSGRAS